MADPCLIHFSVDSRTLHAKICIVRWGKANSGIGRRRSQEGVPPCCLRHLPASIPLRFNCFCSPVLTPPLHHSTIIQYLTKSLYFMIPCAFPVLRSFQRRKMRLFAANQLKFLSMNYLHTKTSLSNRAQSCPIVPNQAKSRYFLCSPRCTNGSISPLSADAFHFAFCILHSAFPALHHSTTPPLR